MRAPLLPPLLLLALLAAPAACARRAPPGRAPGNATRIGPEPEPGAAGGGGDGEGDGALATRVPGPPLALPALEAAVALACASAALLAAGLLLRVCRSGKRLKKTRKYDIITTPAERVEMAPLNDEDDEDEDATVFDIKYR